MICPICKEKTITEYRPFCSKICKDQDLLHWINEDYKIPVEDLTPNEEDKN